MEVNSNKYRKGRLERKRRGERKIDIEQLLTFFIFLREISLIEVTSTCLSRVFSILIIQNRKKNWPG